MGEVKYSMSRKNTSGYLGMAISKKDTSKVMRNLRKQGYKGLSKVKDRKGYYSIRYKGFKK